MILIEKSSSPDSSSGNEPPYPNNYYDPDIGRGPASDNDDDLRLRFSPSRERRLLAKIDLHVIPVLSVLYLLAFLDRTNIANASIFGLQDELRLRGSQYNTALTIFFVPYILFEIPSNVLLKKLKPHVRPFSFGSVHAIRVLWTFSTCVDGEMLIGELSDSFGFRYACLALALSQSVRV